MKLVPTLLLGGLSLIEVPDFITIRRTWRERLFSRPWRPWVAAKLIGTIWLEMELLENNVLVSYTEGKLYARPHMIRRILEAQEKANDCKPT